VILYADHQTDAIRDLLRITKKHREKQIAWNKAHHITPKSVKRAINESVYVYSEAKKTERAAANETPETYDVRETIAALQEEMMQAADALEFERAAYLRDQINALRREAGIKTK
jgi:excinuclease ABC subunit B